MDSCLFCRIVAGEIPSERVAEGEGWLAFRDIAPQAPVHVLIVPTAHLADLNAWPPDEAPDLLAAAARIASDEGLADDGYRVLVNCGRHGGQEVAHLHLHVLGGRPLGPMLARPGG